MTTITSSGIGSGLDVDSIVTQLVAAERTPTETRLTRAESRANYQISGLGSLKSAMSALQAAAKKLLDGGDLYKNKSTSSDDTALAVSATADAKPGAYEVEVLNLAQAHKIASNTFASADTGLGAGTFQVAVGSESFTVTLGATGNSLANLRDAINKASDNKGVTATLIREDAGVRLVLSSEDTGTENALAVTTSMASFTTVQPAVDAQIKVDGYTRTSSSNHIDDAIDGVSLDLLKAEIGTKRKVAVTADTAGASTAVQGFVKAYNTLMTTIKTQTRYDAAAQTSGALNGDAFVRSASQMVKNIVGGTAGSGTYTMLSQLGISVDSGGVLSADATKLTNALEADSGSVRRLFGADDNGIATRLDELFESYLDADEGQIDAKMDVANAQLKRVEGERERLDERMEAVEARYRRQFSSLDAIVNQYSSTASYLTQLLGSGS